MNRQIKRSALAHENCFIIAEIGINHNGDMDLACKTIDAAISSGADAVKFQNYKTSDFISSDSIMYEYTSAGRTIRENQYDMFLRYEMTDDDVRMVKNYCDLASIEFISTPTNIDGVGLLNSIGCKHVKNGSDFLGNLDLISAMAKSGMETIISTGMSTIGEIDEAVTAYRRAGGTELTLLHCTSLYPTPPSALNLRRIPILGDIFNCASGFSDHSEGIAAGVAAVCLGASVIEKHFTLDCNLVGPDHRISSNPSQFRELVDSIRICEAALGSPTFGYTPGELESREQFRLSVTCACDLAKGTVLLDEHLRLSRPGTGLAPIFRNAILGRKALKPLRKGQLISWEDLA